MSTHPKLEIYNIPINFRVSKALKDRYARVLEVNGVTMSDAIRAHMDEYATRHEELGKGISKEQSQK